MNKQESGIEFPPPASSLGTGTNIIHSGDNMKNRTFWIGFVVVYIVAQALGFLVHNVLLGETYRSLASLWRPEQQMMDMMWIMFLTSAVYLFAFCYIFTFGYQARGVMEGVRYGFLMGLFINVPMAFDSYVLYPMPVSLAITWFVAGMITLMILGAIFAAIYRK